MSGLGEMAAPIVEEEPLPTLQPMVEWVAKKFMDFETHQKIHMSLAKNWNRTQSISAAMKLMEKYGVTVTSEEQEKLGQLEEGKQIEALVAKMPSQSAEQFTQFFTELQMLVSTAARVRQSLEKGSVETCEASLATADQSGIAKYLLKMSLVQAGSEVAHQRAEYKNWAKAIDAKMSKMIRGQEDAMTAQKKLAAATATLNAFQAGQNDKAKKVIMNFASGNAKGLMAAAFHGWMVDVKQQKRENEIKAEYEERINAAEGRLMMYRTAHLKGARGVMKKKAEDLDGLMKHEIYHAWKVEIWGNKKTAEDIANLKALEDKLSHSSKAQAENTKKVIARMNGDSAAALQATVWTGWVTYHKDYLKNKELEDRVKKSEQEVQAFLKKKGESAKGIIAAASAGSDTGIIFTCWTAWYTFWQEQKAEAEMTELLQRGDTQFDQITGKNKVKGQTALEKASYHIDMMYYLRFFYFWKLDTRQQKVMRMYHTKIDGKRRQLQGVQDMFRKFANELESGLKASSDVGNTRDWRAGKIHAKPTTADEDNRKSSSKMMGKDVSLPSISPKTGPGAPAAYPAQGAYPGVA
jgi:hypothetical protein